MSKCFYVTTAIDYVNGQPHLGHAYEKVIADVLARARRCLGEPVFFLTGLDEHGQKVQLAAQAEGKNPQEYCDALAVAWRQFAQKLGLSNDDFVRTTEPRHKAVVQAILSRLHAEGHFYKKTHRGFYSTAAETFLTEKDRLPDGSFDPAYGNVIELEEENYYFKLREHQAWLMNYIEANPAFIVPEPRRNEILGFLKNNELEDLCISRPAARLNWGIPIPFDPLFVTYVWFDALLNYISIPAAHGDPAVTRALKSEMERQKAEGRKQKSEIPDPQSAIRNPQSAIESRLDGVSPYRQSAICNPQSAMDLWPADVQVIGKDILKFHAVFWPIMLKAMGLPMPRQILVHGWWQKDGEKLSKSTGNVVDPVAVIDQWGLDAFRYYVIRELDIGPDGNWTDAGFRSRYQAELANGLGNLVNRSLSMIKRYRNRRVPGGTLQLAAEISECRARVLACYRVHFLQEALLAISALITRANQYIDQTSPFKLAKDPAQAAPLDDILYTLAEVCRALGVLLWPVIPGVAEKLQRQLGFPAAAANLAEPPAPIAPGHELGEIFPLFPRKDA
jgi:methionyl-tRNA synthetase